MVASSKRPRRSKTSVAFVLAGGGNLAAMQVGQLRALVEREIMPDLIVGCSAGAMNGAGFARDPSVTGVTVIERIWRQLETAPDSVMASGWLPSPVQLLRKGVSLSTADGMRGWLEELLGPARTFSDLAVAFQCVATDVESSAEKWFDSGPLVPSILASSALPSVYPMVEIGGRNYIDGGVLNNVPISRAIELGATRVYVLHMGLHGRPSHTIKRPIDAAMMAYWIARNGRFARELADVPESVEVMVLPTGQRPDLKFNDFTHTSELIERGYRNAADYLDHQAMFRSETPTARSERLRAETRRVIDELKGRVVELRDRRSGIEDHHDASSEPDPPPRSTTAADEPPRPSA